MLLVVVVLGGWTGLSLIAGLVIAPAFKRRLREINFPPTDD